MEKLKVSQVIVVEGRYDKAKLSSLVDGVIVTTNGFGIYKDSQTLGYLRQAARHAGRQSGAAVHNTAGNTRVVHKHARHNKERDRKQ